MARASFSRYSEHPNLREGPELDAEDQMPIPAKGDKITRNGKTWRVPSASLIKTMHQAPMEVVVTLVPE